MTFSADRQAFRVFDTERGWELSAKLNVGGKNFKLTHTSGAHIVFSGRGVTPPHPDVPRADGFATEWIITSVGHKPSSVLALSQHDQRELITEAMCAYGFFWGDGAGRALLHFR